MRYPTAGALRARGFSVVSPGEVLHEYDVPLAGFLHAFGQTYLFANLLGDARPLGVWGYVEVDEYDVKELLSAYGPEAADAAVEAAFRNRSVTLALAHDHEIRQVANLESEDEGTLALTNRFLHQLQGRLKQDSEETQLLSQDPSLAIA